MFSLLKFEFLKIFQKKSLILFLLLLCIVNLSVFVYAQNLDKSITPTAYQRLQSQLDKIPNEKRYDFIESEYEKYEAFMIIEQLASLRVDSQNNQYMIDILLNEHPGIEEKYSQEYQENHQSYYTDYLESDVEFLNQIVDEFKVLHQYPQYIENIQNQAKTISSISIFQKEADNFEQKNILQSAKDYQQRSSTFLTYTSEKGIHEALSFPLTSVFIMISMMVLAFAMIIEEKEKKLFSIIKLTLKGQYPTMLAKEIVMITMVGIMTFLMVSSQLVYSAATYGLGDLSRSLQSLASFSHCPFSLNVFQFMIIFMVIKWIAASLIGIIMIFISIIVKNKLFVFLSTTMIIVIEYIFYLFIPALSPFYLFKYLNIISILQTDTFFEIYRNVNVFGEPVSLHLLTFICMILVLMVVAFITCITYHYQRNMSLQSFELKIPSLSFKPFLSLRGQELYKVFLLQKVLILCILCIGVQFYQYHDMSLYIDTETKIRQQYMKELEGPLTDEKEQWLLLEKQHYQDLNQQLNQISQKEAEGTITHVQAIQISEPIEQQLVGEKVFQEIYEQYQSIKENPHKQFVFDVAYQQFFMETSWTMMPTLLLFIILILGLSSVINYEYQNQMHRVTQTTLKGNKPLIRIKCEITIMISFIFFVMMTIPPLVLLGQTYGFSSLSASIVSIESLSILPSWMSIGMGCLLSFLLRFFAVLCLTFGIQAIAVKTRNTLLTLFISIFIFLVPILLAYGGYHLLDNISLYPLLFNGQFVQTASGLLQILFTVIGYSLLLVFSIKYIFRYYKS